MSFTISNVPHTIHRPGTHENADLYGHVGGLVAHAPHPNPSTAHAWYPPRKYEDHTFTPNEWGVLRSSHEVLAIHSYQYNMRTWNIGRLGNLY